MRSYSKYIKIFLAVLFSLVIVSVGLIAVVMSSDSLVDTPPKYVFLFIGDGFSYPQLALTSLYKTSVLKEDDLIMHSFKTMGTAYTESGETMITESAAAVSAMASGIKTLNESLNVDKEGNIHETITEKLKNQLGYKIGIISSDNLNHATPAGFYAHQTSRYNDSALIFAELAESGFDYFGGSEILGKPADYMDIFSANGYRYINTREDIEKLTSVETDGKVIAISPNLDPYATIPYKIDSELYVQTFTLAEHTKKCAEFLSQPAKNNKTSKNNKDGFFIMIEGGKIDWACHSNDAATMAHEVIDFDNAIREAIEFYKKHPKDTLIIITGDHETGGLSLGYSETTINMYLDFLKHQNTSFSSFSLKMQTHRQNNAPFEDVMLDVNESFGIYEWDGTQTTSFYLYGEDMAKLMSAYDMSMIDPDIRAFGMSEYVSYGFYDPFTTTVIKIINKKAGIAWSTYSHSAMPVPVLALGKGEENFTGFYRNTEIFEKLKAIMKVK